MKTIASFLVILTTLLVISCNNAPKKPAPAATPVTEEKVTINEKLQKKVGTWAKEGAECYGLVVMTNNKTKAIMVGKSVKVNIIRMEQDSIKVKALEEVSLAKVKDCNKLGISVGYTWWEKEGDLYLTREEADNYIKANGWEYKSKAKGKFKIGD